jgi:hypothetical protein
MKPPNGYGTPLLSAIHFGQLAWCFSPNHYIWKYCHSISCHAPCISLHVHFELRRSLGFISVHATLESLCVLALICPCEIILYYGHICTSSFFYLTSVGNFVHVIYLPEISRILKEKLSSNKVLLEVSAKTGRALFHSNK